MTSMGLGHNVALCQPWDHVCLSCLSHHSPWFSVSLSQTSSLLTPIPPNIPLPTPQTISQPSPKLSYVLFPEMHLLSYLCPSSCFICMAFLLMKFHPSPKTLSNLIFHSHQIILHPPNST